MEAPAPALADGQVLVRLVYLSLDPTNRVWMNEADSYLPALKLGDVMRGGGIGVRACDREHRQRPCGLGRARVRPTADIPYDRPE